MKLSNSADKRQRGRSRTVTTAVTCREHATYLVGWRVGSDHRFLLCADHAAAWLRIELRMGNDVQVVPA